MKYKMTACYGGENISQPIDASYFKGPGSRNGKEREIIATEPVLLESNQNHATVQTNGISTALPASAGMGGGYVQMITEKEQQMEEDLDWWGDPAKAKEEMEDPNYGCNSVVRRLTPLECERLQGFPDNWSKYGLYPDGKVRELSDSARYRLQGNSIARPFWKWLIKRISAQYETTPTMGSLFDGQGGFPLCWEEVNGKGTAIWASEIEKDAVAVTRYHFPEEGENV